MLKKCFRNGKKIIVFTFITLRSAGVKGLLIALRVRLFCQSDFYIYVKDLENLDVKQNFSFAQGLAVRELLPSEVLKIRSGIVDPPSEFFRYELSNPDTCYGAFWKGSLVHVSWVYSYSDGVIQLKSSEVEISYCFTLPNYRGRGIYPVVLNKICEDLKRKGTSRVYLKILKGNEASIRGAEKASFRKCEISRIQWFLGIKRVKPLLNTS